MRKFAASFGFVSVFALLLCYFAACSESGDEIAGGVSEETNTLAGVLVDASGKGLAGVPVVALHYVYDTVRFVDTTDSDGKFGLPLSRQGQYGISAYTDSSAYYETVNYVGEKLSVSAKLSAVGDVAGVLNLRLDTNAVGVYVGIPGTDWGVETDSTGAFELEGVPAGVLPLYAKSPDPMRFNDAVYVVTVSEKSKAKFRGPIPTGLFELFAGETGEVDSVNGFVDVDGFVEYVAAVSSEVLQFPLSTEYGLRSWWSMDYLSVNGKSGTMSDARGWTEGMVVYGGAELVEGVDNKAFAMVGAKQYGVIENDRGLLDSAKEFTLEAWVRVDSVLSDDDSYRKNIVGKLGFGSEGDKDVFSLALVKGECGAKSARFAFFIADGTGDSLSCSNAVVADVGVDYGSWVYITSVWNGESLSLYQDGKLSAEKTVSVNQIDVSSEPIFFGKEAINLKLDDVRFGVKAITSADVLYRYYLKGGAK